MNKIEQVKTALEVIPDPRSKQGISLPFHGTLALVLLGLTARKVYMSHIADWAEDHANYVRETWNVPSCRTLICKVREVRKNGKLLSRTKRYYVSSLDGTVVSAERFLAWVRGHWQVEVRLHLGGAGNTLAYATGSVNATFRLRL